MSGGTINSVPTSVPTNYASNADYWRRAYAGAVAGSEYMGDTGLGLDSSVFNPMMSGSNFGAGFMPYGYGPGKEIMNMTQEEYMDYQSKLQEKQLEHQERMEDLQIGRQVRRKHKIETAEFQANAAEDQITRQIGILQRQVNKDKQGQVMDEYNKLISAVREKLEESADTNVSDIQVNAYAEKLYYQATGGSLIEGLEQHGDNEFVKGLKEGSFGFGFFLKNKASAQDNIAEITGEEKTLTDDIARWSGRLVAGAATLLALPFLAKGGWTLLKNGGGSYKKLLFNKPTKVSP